MSSVTNYTNEEAMDLVKNLKQIFFAVRVLSAEHIHCLEKEKETRKKLNIPFECYTFWNRKNPCKECVSSRCMKTKKESFKLECLNERYYLVNAKYIKIESLPYVLEIIFKLPTTFITNIKMKMISGETAGNYFKKVYYDILTDTYNRRYYEEYLKDRKTFSYVAILDIDNFKGCNDIYGHMFGDIVLINVVKIAKEFLKGKGVIVRYGGDEFIILLRTKDENETIKILDNIREHLSRYIYPKHQSVKITVSIGVTNASGKTAQESFEKADTNLYIAKEKRNIVVSDSKAKENSSIQTLLKKTEDKNDVFLFSLLDMLLKIKYPDLYSHLIRVEAITNLILESPHEGCKMLTKEEKEAIILAAKVHDIGKIFIPLDILNKKENLTEQEISTIDMHSSYGANLIQSLPDFEKNDFYKTIYDVALNHHERIDGKGSPRGLKNISFATQLISLIDSFDNLVVFKDNLSIEESFKKIQEGECGAFSKDVLDLLKTSMDDIKEYYKEKTSENH